VLAILSGERRPSRAQAAPSPGRSAGGSTPHVARAWSETSPSIFTRPVIEEIADSCQNLELAATALVMAIMVGLALGPVAAVWHNR
jgi:hypothetical protein